MEGCESVAHQPNEYILLEHIRFMSEVYYDAISALTTPKKLFRICAIKCKQ
jgi:acetylornithine deacetylase/succinyl-diaminopimelate desuccinylase-like protein